MIVLDCEQNSAAWLRARMGIPTASMFATVMAKGKGGAPSLTRRKYMLQLAGEIITGDPMENWVSLAMERGRAMEHEARLSYAFMEDVDPIQVGFVMSDTGDYGCSPDSLIGDSGMLEIKTAAPHVLIEHILADEFPAEHKAQCQGALWVCEREWIDLSIYWPRMPPFVRRAHRDEAYIADMAFAVQEFNHELRAMVERITASTYPGRV